MFERNFLSLMVAGFLPQMIHLAMLPLYSYKLDLADFGVIGLIMVIVNTVSAVNVLQLQNSVGRLYFDHRDNLTTYFSTIFIAMLGLSIIFLIVTYFISEYLTQYIFQSLQIARPALLLGLLATPFASLNQFFDKWFIVKRQGFSLLKRVLLANGISALTGYLLVVHYDFGTMGYFAAILAGYGLTFCFTILSLRVYLSFHFHPSVLKQSLSYSCPLVLNAIGGMAFMYFGVVILESFVPIAVVGVFVLAERFGSILKIYVNQIGRVISPFFMGLYKQDIEKSHKAAIDIFAIWCLLTFPVFLMFLLAVHIFIGLFFPPEFSAVLQVLPFFIVGFLFRGFYIIESLQLFAEKKTILLAKIGVLSGLASVVLSLFLTKHYGLNGAVIAQMLGWSLQFLFCQIAIHNGAKGLIVSVYFYLWALLFGALLIGTNYLLHLTGTIVGVTIIVLLQIITLGCIAKVRGQRIVRMALFLRRSYDKIQI